jgi:hypothetical protein
MATPAPQGEYRGDPLGATRVVHAPYESGPSTFETLNEEVLRTAHEALAAGGGSWRLLQRGACEQRRRRDRTRAQGAGRLTPRGSRQAAGPATGESLRLTAQASSGAGALGPARRIVWDEHFTIRSALPPLAAAAPGSRPRPRPPLRPLY